MQIWTTFDHESTQCAAYQCRSIHSIPQQGGYAVRDFTLEFLRQKCCPCSCSEPVCRVQWNWRRVSCDGSEQFSPGQQCQSLCVDLLFTRLITLFGLRGHTRRNMQSPARWRDFLGEANSVRHIHDPVRDIWTLAALF